MQTYSADVHGICANTATMCYKNRISVLPRWRCDADELSKCFTIYSLHEFMNSFTHANLESVVLTVIFSLHFWLHNKDICILMGNALYIVHWCTGHKYRLKQMAVIQLSVIVLHD